MDYPRNITVPTHISSYSRWMTGQIGRTTASTGQTGSFAWVANEAVYIPMFLPWPYVARRAYFAHGSVTSGNYDIGIYTPKGALLWSSGSTAGTAVNIQYIAISGGILLQPGRYFMAWTNDGTTNRAQGNGVVANTGRLMGLYQQATALPLPAAATFAQYAGVGVPVLGLTNTASGF